MCEALNKLKTVLVNSIKKKTKVENSVKQNVTAATTNETTSFVLTQEEKAKLRQTILENRFHDLNLWIHSMYYKTENVKTIECVVVTKYISIYKIFKKLTLFIYSHLLDVLWCQPFKLIQVVSTSEFDEYWWNNADSIFFVPSIYCRASEITT